MSLLPPTDGQPAIALLLTTLPSELWTRGSEGRRVLAAQKSDQERVGPGQVQLLGSQCALSMRAALFDAALKFRSNISGHLPPAR